MRIVFALFLGVFTVVAAFSGGFEPRGSFVGADKTRVLAFDAAKTSTWDEIEDLAVDLPHTEGQLTVAVIYPGGGAPTAQLTDAADFLSAVDSIYKGATPWRYRVDIDTNGAIQITDCETDTGGGLLCEGRAMTQMATTMPMATSISPTMANAAEMRR